MEADRHMQAVIERMADLQPGAVPATVFGLVTEALVRRRERDNVAFPNSTEDRITPVTAAFTLRYMDEEATPTLARLCAESSDRIPTWLVPVIRERRAQAGDVTMSAAIIASRARYALRVDEQGEPIDVVDRLKEQLMPLAQRQREGPLAFVPVPSLFGELASDPGFAKPYLAALDALDRVGAHATVATVDGPWGAGSNRGPRGLTSRPGAARAGTSSPARAGGPGAASYTGAQRA